MTTGQPNWATGWGRVFGAIDWHFANSTSEAIASCAQHDNHVSLRLKAKLGFVETGRDMRFSHALQHNVPHVLTALTRASWLAREEKRCA